MKKNIRLQTRIKQNLGIFALGVIAAGFLSAQAPKPDPDVLELTDGEKLIGQFVSAEGGSLTFHSNAAGDVKIDWANVKSLKTSSKFAVVEKGSLPGRHPDLSKIPQGVLAAGDKKITVDSGNGSPAVIPVENATNVVPEASFLNAFKTPSFAADWHGSAGLGIDLVEATQKSRNITAAVAMSRTVSGESWLSPRYRTTVNFNIADSKLTQPGQSAITTDLIHGGIEHDMFLSSKLFAYVSGDFLHSSSQGMELQQTYGGGLGYVVLKSANQELDVKGAIDYIRQNFVKPAGCSTTASLSTEGAVTICPVDKSLVGASLGESYTRTFKGGVAFHEGLTFIPSFNDSKYWTMSTFANFAIPVHKRLMITIGGLDSYINTPPVANPPFKKNSFEFVTQLTYKIN